MGYRDFRQYAYLVGLRAAGFDGSTAGIRGEPTDLRILGRKKQQAFFTTLTTI